MYSVYIFFCFFCFMQKTAYELRISDWSSDVGSSDLSRLDRVQQSAGQPAEPGAGTTRAGQSRIDYYAGMLRNRNHARGGCDQIGRASCRERACQYGSILVVVCSL